MGIIKDTLLILAIALMIVIIIFAGIFGGFPFFIGLSLAGIASCWVYMDAEKRNSEVPFLWALFTFGLLIIGLPAYLVFRPEMPEKKSSGRQTFRVVLCPNCGKYYQEPAKFCPNCGAEIGK